MATKLDLRIDQGSKFTRNIQVNNPNGTPFDLTGYSARMMIRPSVSSATVLLEASTANGRVTINAPGGVVMIDVGADVTSLLTFSAGVYDIEVFTVDPAEVIRIVEGNASLSREVTRV